MRGGEQQPQLPWWSSRGHGKGDQIVRAVEIEVEVMVRAEGRIRARWRERNWRKGRRKR